ncbi:MAG TPA: 2-C-methyl-D-erythritol 4-phosphate cytidylyltransferase [Actinomycetota bacterium]|nr:2-C-methyl-D-erythritol 4-phosphate cytidylyltransferase [Actinomycetota bacterium]
MEARAAAIVLGAGAGTRLGDGPPKAFRDVGGEPMLLRAVRAAATAASVGAVVVTVPPGSEHDAEAMLGGIAAPVTVVPGGATRQASVRAALAWVPASSTIVAVHDAARCAVTPELFERVIAAVDEGCDGAVPVLPVADTVKRVQGDRVVGTVDRDGLRFVQTPQAFRRDVLVAAHERALAAGVTDATDDAVLVEADADVRAVDGDPRNVKVTTAADLVTMTAPEPR